MKKEVMIILMLLISCALCLSGCQSSAVPENVSELMVSDVVRLTEYSLDITRNKQKEITRVEVEGRIESIIDRQIDLYVYTEFYDENDNLVSEYRYEIRGLRSSGNMGSSTTFSGFYSGAKASLVDHVKFRAEEKILS